MFYQVFIGIFLFAPTPCAQTATPHTNDGVESMVPSLCGYACQKQLSDQFSSDESGSAVASSSSLLWQRGDEESLPTVLLMKQDNSEESGHSADATPGPTLLRTENLHADDVRQRIASARRQKAKAEINLAQVAQSYLLKAQISTALLRFDEAAEAYEVALIATPESVTAQMAFAKFNDILDRVPQAFEAYSRALELARRGENQAIVAAILVDIAMLHRRQNQDAEAREALEEAVAIYAQLRVQDLQDFSERVTQIKALLNENSQQ